MRAAEGWRRTMQVVGAAPSQLPSAKHVRLASPLGARPAVAQE